MDGIKIEVTGNIARVTEKPKRITSGTVGLPVNFTFDEQWVGLEKTAVFQAGQVCKIVSGLDVSTTVPWEVLRNAHEWLSIGVYGENEDGSVAIPTIWANVKVIDVGTSPNGDSCKTPSKAEWTRTLIGQSAYELAVALGFTGSEDEWLASLNGNPVELRCVDDMIQWRLQTEPEQEWQDLVSVAEFQQVAADAAERAEKAAGDAEDSAYNKQNKLAWATDEDIDAMFDGTYEGVENEDPEGDGYLPGGGSGESGAAGKSAYEIAQEHGFEGTEEEWLASLKGEKGDKGDSGADGYTPQKGVDYYTDADKEEMVTAVLAALPNGDEVSY